jgi:hypothetical protein
MRSIEISLPFDGLVRMLAFIPVAGFVANGLTFTAGEGDVGRAFGTVTHPTALADAKPRFQERGGVDA